MTRLRKEYFKAAGVLFFYIILPLAAVVVIIWKLIK